MKKEKIQNILLFILIFVSILSIVLNKPLNNLDELWNYNFARNIANRLIPYKDFNMVITPLLSIVCGIILKITFDELIVMRIIAALICACIIYITYKIFCLLSIKREISIIFIIFIWYLFRGLFCIDYNFASLLIALIIIYKEIKHYKKDNKLIKLDIKVDILLGFLAGLAITIKQTSGIFISIVLLGNKLLFVRNKDEFNTYLKSFIFRILGILIPTISLIIYLIINNALFDFISYTIIGISEFDNYISYIKLIKLNLTGLLSIIVPITFIYAWIKTIILENNKEMYIILVYGIAIFCICFPISDEIHFKIASIPIIILMLYEIYNIILKMINKMFKNTLEIKGITYFITSFLILFVIYDSILNFSNYLNKNNYSTIKNYKYIPISRAIENQIKNVDKYIKYAKAKVKILDSTAALYMIPLNRYNKDYDMMNKGNLGLKGEERIIEEIKESNNTQYLILKDIYHKNWQTPINIIEYVIRSKEKVGEIEVFDIYE